MGKKEEKYYIQVWGEGKPTFQEVDGTPIWIKGAEDADLFLHRSVAGGGWRVSSGITGMYVGVGDTKKQAVDDASQKGKPEAIVRQLKQILGDGGQVSPRHSEFKTVNKSTAPVSLDWDNIHKQSREELLLGAGMQLKLANKKWSELEPWIQGILQDSLKGRSKGKAEVGAYKSPLARVVGGIEWEKSLAKQRGLVREMFKGAHLSEELHVGKRVWVSSRGKKFAVEGEYPDFESNTDLQSIHDSRSELSRTSDERQSNLDTIDSDDPRTESWKKHPGDLDIVGVDTPRGRGKRVSSMKKSRNSRKHPSSESQMQSLRR